MLPVAKRQENSFQEICRMVVSIILPYLNSAEDFNSVSATLLFIFLALAAQALVFFLFVFPLLTPKGLGALPPAPSG